MCGGGPFSYRAMGEGDEDRPSSVAVAVSATVVNVLDSEAVAVVVPSASCSTAASPSAVRIPSGKLSKLLGFTGRVIVVVVLVLVVVVVLTAKTLLPIDALHYGRRRLRSCSSQSSYSSTKKNRGPLRHEGGRKRMKGTALV